MSGLIPLGGAKHIYCCEEEWRHAQKKDVRYHPSFWKGVSIETLPMAEDPDAPFGKSCDPACIGIYAAHDPEGPGGGKNL